MRVSRSRGLLSGLLLMLLGAWGALIPFVGPKFHYGFGSYASFHFTWQRLWLDILPGAVAVLGGLLLITAATRRRGVIGGWLAAAGGAWFAVGVPLSTLWQGAGKAGIGPALGGQVHQAAEWVGFFYGVGAAIVFLAAFSIGRLSVVSVGDVRMVEEPPQAETVPQHSPAAEPVADRDPEPALQARAADGSPIAAP
jgi:hypothetical protein